MGWCLECRRIKFVRASVYRLVGMITEGQGAGMFEGVCADCEDV